MRIYTRSGDTGETGLFGGSRVDKDDPRVESYGTVDELNAALGTARAAGLAPEIDAIVLRVQNELFTLGAELACVPGKEQALRLSLISQADVDALEGDIDRSELGLAELKTFVLPGGSLGATLLHQARTICRRAERCTLAAGRSTPLRSELVVYLNRLSDLLFVLARRENLHTGQGDVLWQKR
jgi:cob(I)alamin adenosyltransferase